MHEPFSSPSSLCAPLHSLPRHAYTPALHVSHANSYAHARPAPRIRRRPRPPPAAPPATPVRLIPEDWTNAQRLAARLPPRAPQNLRRTPTRRSAPSPSPSPRLRVTKEGHIEVHDVHTGARVGFVSSSGARLSADAELVDLEAADAGRSGTRFIGGTGPAA
ncbi:hypothetical protein A0H81_13880 [Grifola frondosa]|uniref:Uncharacterized protein n=1 Tax=Grifola frondosa TaxID=5627 RepID=A0A1C7LN06_GRIFR|nr:hypothetical protein A0H81_13880 [Grifola frondosa]